MVKASSPTCSMLFLPLLLAMLMGQKLPCLVSKRVAAIVRGFASLHVKDAMQNAQILSCVVLSLGRQLDIVLAGRSN